ncbi:MAG: membrane protein YqaA with SNARE-associated domain [Candidatus Azotimanducaceae bacterium]|jgi:membrane protein YqaA with SNARE-associated domain
MKDIDLQKESPAVVQVTQTGISWLRSKYAMWYLAAIAFAESFFVPIIIDPFLVALILARRTLWKKFVIVAVAASITGGLAGYALGAFLFETVGAELLAAFGLSESFSSLAESFDSNGFVFVLIGAFTPVPYKIVAIASGVLEINIITFIVASLFGRFFRLGLVGFAAYALGPHALPMMQRNLHWLAGILGVVLIGYIIFQLR